MAATEDLSQLAGFRRGVPLQNNHRGATLQNSEYLAHGDTVQPVELENLKRVFKWLDTKKDDKICWQELSEALVKLGAKTAKDQIELWIWEVDDDLDHMVGWDEFLTMYQRCISDQTGFEPRNLFNLVQFLMYDKDFHGKISVEQTLQIIYVRHGDFPTTEKMRIEAANTWIKRSGRSSAKSRKDRMGRS